MKSGAFDYVRPETLAEALKLLDEGNGSAQLMAGGQSLVAMMNLRVVNPDLVIDIGRLAELREVSEDDDWVMLGACVTHAAIEDGLVPDPSRGLMQRAAAGLAYRAIRSHGTIGGSLALADPAAEWPTVLAALDAQAILRGPGGRRSAPCSTFVTGVYQTEIAQDEIVESIRIPKLSPASRWGYLKFCRKSGEFATSLTAVVLDPERGYARAVLGAANGPPIMLEQTSALIAAGGGTDDAVCGAIAKDIEAAGDRGFDEFLLDLHATVAARAIRQVMQ